MTGCSRYGRSAPGPAPLSPRAAPVSPSIPPPRAATTGPRCRAPRRRVSPGGTASSASLLLTGTSGYLLTPTGRLIGGPVSALGTWAALSALPTAVQAQPSPRPRAPPVPRSPTARHQAAWWPPPAPPGWCCSAPARLRTDSQVKAVYTSSDGGATWHLGGTAPAAGTATSVAGTPSGAIVIATTLGIEISADGGATWTAASAATPPGGFAFVGMTTSARGVAVPADAHQDAVWLTVMAGRPGGHRPLNRSATEPRRHSPGRTGPPWCPTAHPACPARNLPPPRAVRGADRNLAKLGHVVAGHAELGGHQVLGGPGDHLAARRGDLRELPRPSRGFGRRTTRPRRSSRSMVLVALVGCTISRWPITRIGSAPRRLKVSSTSASYRANVSPCRRRTLSSSASKICCARMIEVTAAIASAGPNRCSHVCAARAIGSNGRSSGVGTGTRYSRGHRDGGWQQSADRPRSRQSWPREPSTTTSDSSVAKRYIAC